MSVWLQTRLSRILLRDVRPGSSSADRLAAAMVELRPGEPAFFEHLSATNYVDDKDVEVVERPPPPATPSSAHRVAPPPPPSQPSFSVVDAGESASSAGEPDPPTPRRRRTRRKKSP